MRMSTQRRLARSARLARIAARRRQHPDATINPELHPEAVFDRTTGPHGGPCGASAYRSALALPGAYEYDEET
jgi:hypothetical protein